VAFLLELLGSEDGSWKFVLPVAMRSYCRISETSNDLLKPKFHVMRAGIVQSV
jgi:hypothetical protein